MSTGTLISGPLPKIGRQELQQIPVPEATLTHKPVPHHVIVEALVETLSFRHLGVVNEFFQHLGKVRHGISPSHCLE